MDEQIIDEKYEVLKKEIASVLNKYSQENRSNTPDFMLAEYLLGCLTVYENTIVSREEWLRPNSKLTTLTMEEVNNMQTYEELKKEWYKLYGDDFPHGNRDKYLDFFVKKMKERDQKLIEIIENSNIIVDGTYKNYYSDGFNDCLAYILTKLKQ